MNTSYIAACDIVGGQIQVFAIQSDGSILTRWKESTDPNSAWTAWAPFQGLPQDSAWAICTATLPDQRIQLFAMDLGGNIFTCWKYTTAPNSGWTGWTLFQPIPESFFTNGLTTICAATLPDQRTQLFGTDGHGNILTCWKYTLDPDSGWTGWSSFQQPWAVYYVRSGTLSDQLCQLFAYGHGGSIVTCWKESEDPGSDWSAWIAFQDVPGGNTLSSSIFATPVPGLRLQLFFTNEAGNIFSCWKDNADPNSDWSAWEPFLGLPQVGAGLICAATLPDQRTQLFALDTNGNTWTCWKESSLPNAAWSAWQPF